MISHEAIVTLMVVVPVVLFVLVFLCWYYWGKSATSTSHHLHDGSSTYDNQYACSPLDKLSIVNERQQQPLTLEEINSKLRQLQQEIQDENADASEIVRLAQDLLLLPAKYVPPTEATLHSTIVIGVDATPWDLGGYCVNLNNRTIQWYHIKMEDFPWTMEGSPNNPDPAEFEMKNLQFALALWGDLIRRQMTFHIYTDNMAVNNRRNKYGLDAAVLINHFTHCKGIRKINRQVHVNKNLELEQFAIYIQPADEISRWKISKGVDFLSKYYRINNVQGTHTFSQTRTAKSRARYDKNENYGHYIEMAKRFAANFQCENCNINTFTNEPTRGRLVAGMERVR